MQSSSLCNRMCIERERESFWMWKGKREIVGEGERERVICVKKGERLALDQRSAREREST